MSEWDDVQGEALEAARRISPDISIPEVCWARRLSDRLPSDAIHRPSRPGFRESLSLLPAASRVSKYLRKERDNGREPIFDLEGTMMLPPNPGPHAGVPMGGIGSGSIGRGIRGDFRGCNFWPLRPVQKSSKISRFSLRVAPSDESDEAPGEPFCTVLDLNDSKNEGAFEMGKSTLDPSNVYYCAVYPRSWNVYDNPTPGIKLTCRQVSPVFPNEYRETTFPTSVFIWTISNESNESKDVSIMLTFETYSDASNTSGHSRYKPQSFTGESGVSGVFNALVYKSKKVFEMKEDKAALVREPSRLSPLSGRSSHMNVETHEDTFSVAITTKSVDGVNSSHIPSFNLDNDVDSDSIWRIFSNVGDLTAFTSLNSARSDTAAACATCLKASVEAGQSKKLVFSLAWDVPFARFGCGKALPKRYTRYFGRSGLNAHRIAEHAIDSYERWEQLIDRWQNPILCCNTLPKFYRYTLFNELYFLTSGGSLWLDSVDGKEAAYDEERFSRKHIFSPNDRQDDSENAPDSEPFPSVTDLLLEEVEYDSQCHGDPATIGQFLYLEGLEYLMYNTYDVHFYASFALARLWPMLELSLQKDIASSVFVSDLWTRSLLSDGSKRPRKVEGAVPHDLGSPYESPWLKPNAYVFQDVSRWKDLAPKFVLQICRDYAFTGSIEFLRTVYKAAERVMEQASKWDTDGDCLIENEGFPDQTYDIWIASGPSAYSGCLWVAALSAMTTMSHALDLPEDEERYYSTYKKARNSFEEKLWNGLYFNYDCSKSKHACNIMSDQLAGQWYARLCGIDPPVEEVKALSTYEMILTYNLRYFSSLAKAVRAKVTKMNENYSIGLVNGMSLGGNPRIDDTCIQSREVWTGVTYASAAAMILEAEMYLLQKENARREGRSAGTNEQFGEERLRALIHGAFECARGIHNASWNAFGYWFQTPEAYNSNGNYRSLSYMRPLSIWSIQCAIEKFS